MSELEKDYTLDVPEEATLQQALDIRIGPNRLRPGQVIKNASFTDLSHVLQAAWLHNASVTVSDLDTDLGSKLGVDVSSRNEIDDIDTVSGLCRVERGATPAQVRTALLSHGQWLPLGFFRDSHAAIGPAIESGEGGHLVASIDAVLPDGTRFKTPLAPRRATGPNPDYALIGSGGRLGVITHATLRTRMVPRWSEAIKISGRTEDIIERMRLLLRGYQPGYAWFESTAGGTTTAAIVPGIHPLPSREAKTDDWSKANCEETGPTPPCEPAQRRTWRQLLADCKNTAAWVGPLDTHGGWARGITHHSPKDQALYSSVQNALDAGDVLK